jgi:hypothetical protein
MMSIPNALAQLSGIAPGLLVSDLINKIAQGQIIVFDGLLNLEANRNAIEESLGLRPSYRLSYFDSIQPITAPKVCQIYFQENVNPVLVGSMGEPEIETLSTELEKLVFWSLLDPNLISHVNTRSTTDGDVIDWRNFFKGKVIIAEPINSALSPLSMPYVHSLFGLKTLTNCKTQAPQSPTISASTISIGISGTSITNSNVRLAFEAVTETSPKWRAFSLYRILENAYLDNIKNEMLRRFDTQPKFALKEAATQLSSELTQLITLAESTDLRSECVKWNDTFEILLTTQNSYAIAIDSEAREDRDIYGSKPEKIYKKALLRLYKLRCSIAHAGTSSVIYEQHTDADAAAITLIPDMEEIIYKLLKIQITQ